jgi:hypothetical protein
MLINPSWLEILDACVLPNTLPDAAVNIAPVESCTNLRRSHVIKVRPQSSLYIPMNNRSG